MNMGHVLGILVIIGLVVAVLFFQSFAIWDLQDKVDRRITQLECALAQAHAHADTLEAAIESIDRRCGE